MTLPKERIEANWQNVVARLSAQLRDREEANRILVERLLELQRSMLTLAADRGLVLPGWFCPVCRAFNGEAMGPMLKCRACQKEKPR